MHFFLFAETYQWCDMVHHRRGLCTLAIPPRCRDNIHHDVSRHPFNRPTALPYFTSTASLGRTPPLLHLGAYGAVSPRPFPHAYLLLASRWLHASPLPGSSLLLSPVLLSSSPFGAGSYLLSVASSPHGIGHTVYPVRVWTTAPWGRT
jgi:hypothetical protein